MHSALRERQTIHCIEMQSALKNCKQFDHHIEIHSALGELLTISYIEIHSALGELLTIPYKKMGSALR